MNLAEITSFEQLIGLMMQKDMISERVVYRLWNVFCTLFPFYPPSTHLYSFKEKGNVSDPQKGCFDCYIDAWSSGCQDHQFEY